MDVYIGYKLPVKKVTMNNVTIKIRNIFYYKGKTIILKKTV